MKKFLLLCSACALVGLATEPSLNAAENPKSKSTTEHSQKAQRVSCEALDPDAPGLQCALAWLRMMDGRDYRQAWIAASDYLQQHYTLERWQRFLNSWRPELGTIKSREMTYSDYCCNVKGLPKGQYLVVYYKTSFECYGPTCEKLVLRCEWDCACEARWKVARYCVE